MLNKDLLLTVSAWVQKQAVLADGDRKWAQRHWICGTRHCFAGEVCCKVHGQLSSFRPDGYPLDSSAGHTDSGAVISIRNEAIRLLGITDTEADLLFSGNNDAKDICDMVQRIIKNHEGEEEDYVE